MTVANGIAGRLIAAVALLAVMTPWSGALAAPRAPSAAAIELPAPGDASATLRCVRAVRPLPAPCFDAGALLFLQRDPSGYEDSVNLYAGFGHDPINHRDVTGEFWHLVGGAAIGAAIGAGLDVLHQYAEAKDAGRDFNVDWFRAGSAAVRGGAAGLAFTACPACGVALSPLAAGVSAQSAYDNYKAGNKWTAALNVVEGVAAAWGGIQGAKAIGNGKIAAVDPWVRGRLAGAPAAEEGAIVAEKACPMGGCGKPSGACFVAGTEVKTSSGYVPIESLVIGDRVLTDEDCLGTEVDPATWAVIGLEMPNPDGSDDVLDLRILRPLTWLDERGGAEGALIEINLPEMKLRGLGRVTAVEDVPTLLDEPGCLVLSTVTHLNGHILELRFEDAAGVLEPTAEHHFFSYDTKDWVPAGDLQPGDKLATSTGFATVAAAALTPGVRRVFNLEVETRHAYYVSDLDILSHNTGDCPATVDPQGDPFHDPAPPQYARGHPSLPVEDHIVNRARGGSATAKENLHTKTWEANSRKGGLEGSYARALRAYMRAGLSRKQATYVLEGEAEYIETDVHARPVDPSVLDALPNQGEK